MFDRARPYNDLPLLPPATTLESPVILKKAIAAHRVLAELKGLGEAIPNQSILINGLILQEARLSSEIENVVTTNDELYQAAADEQAVRDPQTKEVLRYREALWYGFHALQERPLSTNLIVDLARIIKQTNIGIRRVPGTKIANASGEIIYTPPEGETTIRDKLANLERFIHAEDELDPLVKMAVVHYQFEAIHPFVDGNGRTGRILNILFLVEKGLLDMPVLYLSYYILRHRNAYYEGLQRVTEQSTWQEWVLYMLSAIEDTAQRTRRKILRIRELMQVAQERVRQEAPKVYSKDLIELIFENPYCKIRFLENAGLAKRQTASVYLQTLENLGLLRGRKIGREAYYINDALMQVLIGEQSQTPT